MRTRPWAIWATLVVVAATTFAVSVDGARSPMRGVGLLTAKYPALAAGVFLCAVACAAGWWRRGLRIAHFDVAALGYAVTCALSVALHTPALPHILPWLALNLAAFIVVAAACEGAKQNPALLLDGLVVIAALVAAVAIYESVGGSLPWDVSRRPGATFANRNAVGGFCAIVIPLAISRVLVRPGYGRAVVLASLILTVLLCRARSSWMGLLSAGAVTLVIMLLARRTQRAATPVVAPRARRTLIFAVVIAITALYVVPWSGLQWKESSPILSSFSRMLEYDTGTGQSRVDQHRVGIRMLEESPLFGLGPGSWRREAPRFVHEATGYHTKFIDPLWTPASDVLRHAVETGLIGFVAAALMLIALLVGARSRIADLRDPVPLALMCGLVVAIVISAFDAILYRPHSVTLVAAIAGALRNECRRGTRQLPAWAGITAISLSAAVCLALLLPRYFAAMAYFRSFSPETVIALGDGGFLPHEALIAVRASRKKGDCAALSQAATIIDTYLPNEPENLWVLASCAKKAGRWGEAEQLLDRLLRLEPHDEVAARELERLRSRGAARARPVAPARIDAALRSAFLAYYPMGVNLSPDGTRLLAKSRGDDDFELRVLDAATGKPVAAITSPANQFGLSWAPDGRSIVYLHDDRGDRRFQLFRWHLSSDTPALIAGIVTQSAAPPLRWSPDGSALLMYRGGARRGTVDIITDLDRGQPSVRTVGALEVEGDFQWSPDGSKIALIRHVDSGSLSIVDPRNPGAEVVLSISPGALMSQLAWSPDGASLLVTARRSSEEFFSLFQVPISGSGAVQVYSPNFDLSSPLFTPDGKRFLVEANHAGRFEIVRGDLSPDGSRETLTAADASLRSLGLTKDGSSLVVRGGTLDRSPTVAMLRLAEKGRVLSAAGQAVVEAATPRFVQIATNGTRAVPTFVWVPESAGLRARGALVFVHGGPHLQELPVLEGRVSIPLAHEMVVAIPNYRGSKGYGVTWERVKDADLQAEDLFAVIQYLEREYRIPTARITLVASSWGNVPALRLAVRHPTSMGALVLTSLVKTDGSTCALDGFAGTVIGFHGERDPLLSAEGAKRVFDLCTGDAAASEWHVLRNEGHIFYRTPSRVQILEAALRAP